MSMISVSGLTFGYESSYDLVFENATFQLDTDWKLGFTGRNGRGKTTFLKLLMGEYPYSGTITASVDFSYFPFPVAHPECNTLDIIDALNPDYEFWELCRELNLLEVPEDVLFRPFESLSQGEQTKTMIAALFLRKNHFLLLDEPTNHLDYLGKQVMADYLKSKKGFILVSHDRKLLDDVVDHTLSINRMDIEVQKGGFSQWLETKQQRDENEKEQNARLKKDIGRLEAAARRTADWSNKVEASKTGSGPVDRGFIGHKSAKMMKKSKNIENRQSSAIEEKSKLLRNVETQEALKLSPLAYHANTLASFTDISVRYGDRTILQDFSLEIKRGDRIALKGRNGSGKSSLIKLLLGQDIPHVGSFTVGSNLLISYMPQDTSHLTGGLQAYAEAAGIDRTLFMAILRKLGFERVQFEKDMRALSEGQKKKVLLAKSLSESAHLYVWDEPLNYIDIQSRMQIEELLERYKPTMLFVEHDEVFLQKIATEICLLTSM